MTTEDDERWLVVDGRRWRRTDPGVPEPLRKELVDELMAARRAVGGALRAGDEVALAEARRRVGDAKVALGERGEPWWDEPSEQGRRQRMTSAISTLARHRAPRTTCPSDAARAIGGSGWRRLMPLAREVARELAASGEIEIMQKGAVVDPSSEWRGPIRLKAVGGRGSATPVALGTGARRASTS